MRRLRPAGNLIVRWMLTVQAEARLGAHSTTEWYLFGQPQHGACLVAFLNDNQGAYVETLNTAPNVLGVTSRAFMNFGVSLGEWRGREERVYAPTFRCAHIFVEV
jgi:hypothetical protein